MRASTSLDGGASWTDDVPIASGEFATIPVPAIDHDGRIYVVYAVSDPDEPETARSYAADGRPRYALRLATSAEGKEWTTSDLGVEGSWFPSIAASAGTVHVGYVTTDGAPAVLTSPDGGRTWRRPQELAPGGPVRALTSAAAASEGRAVAGMFTSNDRTMGYRIALLAPDGLVETLDVAEGLPLPDQSVGDYAGIATARSDGTEWVAAAWVLEKDGATVPVVSLLTIDRA